MAGPVKPRPKWRGRFGGPSSFQGEGMRLVPLPSEALDEWWPVVLPYAQKMTEVFPTDWPISAIRNDAAAGKLLLWLIWDHETKQAFGVVGVQVLRKGNGDLIAEIAMIGAEDHRRWLHLLPDLEADAKARGCVAIKVRGREGWARLLPEYRMRREIVLSKEL